MDDDRTVEYSIQPTDPDTVELSFSQDGKTRTIKTDREGLEELIGALRRARDQMDAARGKHE